MFTTRPEITGTFGVASSTHWLAAQTAMGVLERGGNAFDAACAAAFVLQVVEPHLNGPGGEVPILLWSEREQRLRAINGQGFAPADASPTTFRRMGFEQVPGIGPLAATVPGAVPAWLTLLKEHGTWPLADVLAPALGYARDGFPLVARAVQAILAVRELFLTDWPSSAAVWLPDGKVPRPGALHRLPVMAAMYTRLIETAEREGGKAGAGVGNSTGSGANQQRSAVIDAAIRTWQEGFVAREIDAWCRNTPVRDSSGEAHCGLLRLEDIAAWRVTESAPLTMDIGRYSVAKCGFWSQGPMLLQQIGMLRHAGLEQHAPGTAGFVHRVTEAAKLALADRYAWYGIAPGARADLPVLQQALLSDDYLRARWAQVDLQHASTTLQPGHPLGQAPHLPDLDVAARSLRNADTGFGRFGLGEPTFANLPPVSEWAEREIFVGDTCHIDVIDRHGNMVAATPSGGWLSSSPVIPALGFALSTRLQTTWLDEGLPNTLTPHVAPCITLSPSMALRDGAPYLAFGTPGGDQQDQWQMGFLLRHILHGFNLQEAIDAPSWHVKHFPGSFWPRQTTLNTLTLESRFDAGVIEQLRALGHHVIVGDAWSESRLSACSRVRDAEGRLVLRAAANPRGMQGYAVGR